ncbi:MAG: ATPase P [Desulfuromonas sp.]|nr:MAG: ATPase P [Desulfuromonas sp.]
MLTIAVPGYTTLTLQHLVLDYNGTLACDGQLLDELVAPLQQLAKDLTLHVITADTHGSAAQQLAAVNARLEILPQKDQDKGKQQLIQQLGAHLCVAIGNGYNDRLMLAEAALGIAVIAPEAAATPALQAADICCLRCVDALTLLTRPARLIATLRR